MLEEKNSWVLRINIKKGYNLVLSTNCGNSFVNHPEGFFISSNQMDCFSPKIELIQKDIYLYHYLLHRCVS